MAAALGSIARQMTRMNWFQTVENASMLSLDFAGTTWRCERSFFLLLPHRVSHRKISSSSECIFWPNSVLEPWSQNAISNAAEYPGEECLAR